MTQVAARPSIDAEAVFAEWLACADAATRADDDGAAYAELFAPDGYWRDILAFTWDFRTFSGRGEIADAFKATRVAAAMSDLRLGSGRMPPRTLRRGGETVVEAYFDFDTALGRGSAFVRLLVADDAPVQAFIMLTTLQELHGHEEQIGSRRPSGAEWSYQFSGDNWAETRARSREYSDREPEVVIIGAGQAGLALAARLRVMGVDALLLERNQRVGDNWRHRYHSLTLHNEAWANHLPYVPFPETWPAFVPKDKLADFLESYADTMELNVWTGVELGSITYDKRSELWTIPVTRSDHELRELRVPQLVVATGSVSGVPRLQRPDGLENFRGQVLHSSQFTGGTDARGTHAIVVGTGNSGHDVAQELYGCGAQVTMLQRSSTCVVSLVPSGTLVYALYQEGAVDDIDLITASIPYPVLRETYQWMTKRTRELDAELLGKLDEAGFETDFDYDDTGFHMKYLRYGGGYYINVGCSDLIGERRIDVVNTRDVVGFGEDAMQLADGRAVSADLVVLATGYENQKEGLRRLLGDVVAEQVGETWGFDDNGFMRNMWRPTGADRLWLMGGALNDCRLYSRFLAVQLAAAVHGIAPQSMAS